MQDTHNNSDLYRYSRPAQSAGSGLPPRWSEDTKRFEREWTIVKAARFNASKRFEAKHAAGTLSLAIGAVFGFVLPVYPLIFQNAISRHSVNVIDLCAYSLGALSFALGFFDLAKNYPERARQFHDCGKAVNKILRQLKNGRIPLPALIEEYDQAIEACPHNHDDIDYEIGRLQYELKTAEPHKKSEHANALASLKWKQWWSIYLLYLIAWATPVLAAIWLYNFGPVET